MRPGHSYTSAAHPAQLRSSIAKTVQLHSLHRSLVEFRSNRKSGGVCARATVIPRLPIRLGYGASPRANQRQSVFGEPVIQLNAG
jgi:hypothetical protein